MSYFTLVVLWLFSGLLGWMWFNHMVTSFRREAGQGELPGKLQGFFFLAAGGFFTLVMSALQALFIFPQRHRWGLRLW